MPSTPPDSRLCHLLPHAFSTSVNWKEKPREGCDAELEVRDMLDLELFWLEWTTGQGNAATISLILLGLVLALVVYVFLLSTRLRIAQEIFGSLNVFGPPLFSIKEIGCAMLAVLFVVMAILTGLWIFALR
jgi:hypothetical protein